MRLTSENQMPRAGLGPGSTERLFPGGLWGCACGLFFRLWYTVPDWTNYLGLSFCVYHHQISLKTINSYEVECVWGVVFVQSDCVCVLILCFRTLPVFSNW